MYYGQQYLVFQRQSGRRFTLPYILLYYLDDFQSVHALNLSHSPSK